MVRLYMTGHNVVLGQSVAVEFGDVDEFGEAAQIRYYQRRMDYVRRLVEKFNAIQLVKAKREELEALRDCANAVVDYNDGKTSWDYPLGHADHAIKVRKEIEWAESRKGK